MVTSLVLALIVDTREMSDDNIWIPLQPAKLAKRIISRFSQIKPSGTINNEDLELAIAAYFTNRSGCVCFRRSTNPDEPFDEDEFVVSKEIPSNPGIIYMETVPGSSKIKENIARLKLILEFRIFLKSLGVTEVTKPLKISDIGKNMGISLDDMRIILREKFDNRNYTKPSVEETMNLQFIELVSDIPYASQVLESIFVVNPYQ